MEAPASCDSGNRFPLIVFQPFVQHPPHACEDIREPFVREQRIEPAEYYPDGYKPELLEKWPVEGDLVVRMEDLPDNLKQSIGDAWRHKQQNQQILREQGRP